VAKQPAS